MHDNSEPIPAKRHRVQHIETYEVTADELDGVEREGQSVGQDLQFATVFIPIGITLTAVLTTTSIPDIRLYTAFLVALCVSYGFGATFLIRWWRQRGRFLRLMAKIREKPIGPLGEEGKELGASALAELPAVEPKRHDPQGVTDEHANVPGVTSDLRFQDPLEKLCVFL